MNYISPLQKKGGNGHIMKIVENIHPSSEHDLFSPRQSIKAQCLDARKVASLQSQGVIHENKSGFLDLGTMFSKRT